MLTDYMMHVTIQNCVYVRVPEYTPLPAGWTHGEDVSDGYYGVSGYLYMARRGSQAVMVAESPYAGDDADADADCVCDVDPGEFARALDDAVALLDRLAGL